MYIYTLAFIRRGDEVLMINRQKQPWMGSWNGVGGKRMLNEDPLTCIIREIYEETGIEVNQDTIIDKGLVTWDNFKAYDSGLHVFLVNLSKDYEYDVPKSTREGILDFKKIDWISDYDNYGLAHNIPYFINDVLYSNARYNHHCLFIGNKLIKVTKEVLCSD